MVRAENKKRKGEEDGAYLLPCALALIDIYKEEEVEKKKRKKKVNI